MTTPRAAFAPSSAGWPCEHGSWATTFRTNRGALCWKHRGRTMRWAIRCPTGLANPVPLVLLMDKIDSLVGDTLLSVLRQLRAGYEQRPVAARSTSPREVVAHGRLHGSRDVRPDGAAHRGDRAALLGGGAGGGMEAIASGTGAGW